MTAKKKVTPTKKMPMMPMPPMMKRPMMPAMPAMPATKMPKDKHEKKFPDKAVVKPKAKSPMKKGR